MTSQQLKIIRRIIVNIHDEIECATIDEIGYVLECIDEDLYRAECKEFLEHLQDEMHHSELNDAAMRRYCETPIIINFAGKEIKVHNENPFLMLSLIDFFTDECKED